MAFIIFIIIVMVMILVSIALANWFIYGQDIDSRYVCEYSNTFPFSELCKQRHADQQEVMNIINEACDVDESLCLLKEPDPDFEYCEGNLTAMDREICDQ